MAATVRQQEYQARVLYVQGDASYATGGYALSDLALATNNPPVTPAGINDGAAIIALYDAPNQKVKFITAATGAEVANLSNQSANIVKVALFQ